MHGTPHHCAARRRSACGTGCDKSSGRVLPPKAAAVVAAVAVVAEEVAAVAHVITIARQSVRLQWRPICWRSARALRAGLGRVGRSPRRAAREGRRRWRRRRRAVVPRLRWQMTARRRAAVVRRPLMRRCALPFCSISAGVTRSSCMQRRIWRRQRHACVSSA